MNRIQLILLVDETTNSKTIKNQDLSGYSQVDLLYWGDLSDLLRNYGELNFNLHQVHLDVASHINQFAWRDCDYYVISDGSHKLEKFPPALNLFSKEHPEMALLMIRPPAKDDFNGMVINSLLHHKLCGFGEQTIFEKIDIFAKNHSLEDYVFASLEDFLRG